ncbi:MAG: hypothetical protein OEQ13_07410, partial [Acidobacteriota bacterium]|nr:hypothetical protein [Acidobacteriota bacterium]
WPIDFVDQTAERPRSGTVAVLTGDAWSGSDRQSWDWVEVRDLAGSLLLREEFDDAQAFRSRWDNPAGGPQDFDATIVVGHRSFPFLEMPRLPSNHVDLLLAGHTHGGQIRLPMFGPLYLEAGLPRRWSMGFVPLPSRSGWLYTSRGLGVSKVPIRFLCPPEVTLMEVILRHRPPL